MRQLKQPHKRSDSHGIQKKERIVSGPREKLRQEAEKVLNECKGSRNILVYVCHHLLRPATFLRDRTPRIPDRELVTAIRVSESVLSNVLSDPDKAARWEALQRRLCQLVRFQNLARPLLTVRDYRAARRVVNILSESWGDDLETELKELEHHQLYDAWDPEKRLGANWKTLLAQNPKKARRGRRFTEHHERIVACHRLLRKCAEEDPGEKIAQILFDHGTKIEAASVDRIVQRYAATPKFDTGGIYPQEDQLLTGWLEIFAQVVPPPTDYRTAEART